MRVKARFDPVRSMMCLIPVDTVDISSFLAMAVSGHAFTDSRDLVF
jgi:hypothetical protein